MKILNILLVSLIGMNFAQAQATKVAILDFENTSGKPEYDALAKAISSMLITDLANNIHPKKVEFFERSQLIKLLDEQKLQKSKNFDAKTAVDFGKLSGVNYVFVGSVFVLDGTCNFSSKLVDVQTSKILLAKEVSGTIVNFLQLKSQLAEAIAIQLNNPITLDPSYKDQSTTLSTINQYGKILTTMDQGDADKAEQMRSLFEETNPDFKYFKDLTEDIVKIKIEIKEIKETLDDVLEPEKIALELIAQNKELDKAIKYLDLFNAKNNYASAYGDTKKLFTYHQKARIYYRLGDFKKSILYYDSTLYLDKNYLTAYLAKMTLMMGGDFAKRLDKNITTVLKPDRDYSKEIEVCFVQFTSYGKKNISSFNPKIYRDGEKVCENNPMSQDCLFFRHRISIPGCFGDVYLEPFSNHILRPSNLYSNYLISINQSKKALLILENCLFQQFEFFKDTKDYIWENPDPRWIDWTLKDRTFNLLAPQEKKDYNSIVDVFNPIFKMHGKRQLIGEWGDNSGFTDNIVLLSNLLVFEKRYNDAINLLVGFRTIFNTNTDKYADYGIEKFKVLVNIFLLSKLAGKENLNIHAECEQIYEKEKDKILVLFGQKNLSFEQFLEVEFQKLQNYFRNSDIKIGLIEVFDNIQID